jgi:hypothetical protein
MNNDERIGAKLMQRGLTCVKACWRKTERETNAEQTMLKENQKNKGKNIISLTDLRVSNDF